MILFILRADTMSRRPGDWLCPVCHVYIFASKTECRKCHTKRPCNEMAKDDWICPKCKFIIFGSKTYCKKCDVDRNGRSKSAGNSEETGNECCVCLEKKATRGFNHGDSVHVAVCENCVSNFSPFESRCPICREVIQSISRVF